MDVFLRVHYTSLCFVLFFSDRGGVVLRGNLNTQLSQVIPSKTNAASV